MYSAVVAATTIARFITCLLEAIILTTRKDWGKPLNAWRMLRKLMSSRAQLVYPQTWRRLQEVTRNICIRTSVLSLPLFYPFCRCRTINRAYQTWRITIIASAFHAQVWRENVVVTISMNLPLSLIRLLTSRCDLVCTQLWNCRSQIGTNSISLGSNCRRKIHGRNRGTISWFNSETRRVTQERDESQREGSWGGTERGRKK